MNNIRRILKMCSLDQVHAFGGRTVKLFHNHTLTRCSTSFSSRIEFLCWRLPYTKSLLPYSIIMKMLKGWYRNVLLQIGDSMLKSDGHQVFYFKRCVNMGAYLLLTKQWKRFALLEKWLRGRPIMPNVIVMLRNSCLRCMVNLVGGCAGLIVIM